MVSSKKTEIQQSSRANGFLVSFFKHNWDIVCPHLVAVVQDFFQDKKLDEKLNKTFLFLIPKTKHPKSPSYYRPIGLCNTPYKLIAKLMANRFKKSLENIISPLQSAFLSSRQISDNIIVAHEIVHCMKKNK